MSVDIGKSAAEVQRQLYSSLGLTELLTKGSRSSLPGEGVRNIDRGGVPYDAPCDHTPVCVYYNPGEKEIGNLDEIRRVRDELNSSSYTLGDPFLFTTHAQENRAPLMIFPLAFYETKGD